MLHLTHLALGAFMIFFSQHAHGHGPGGKDKPHGGKPHAGGHDHKHRHGNPEDLDAYIAKMEDPSRDAWQKPDEVLKALALKPGQTVCDIGAGPGYFSIRFGAGVGDAGTVFAVDVEPKILDALRARVAKRGVKNVVPVLGLPDDPLLPPAACDVIVVVDTFHHFPDGVAYLRRLARSLRKGGRIVNIDFHKRENPVGPPVDHLVSREEFLGHAAKAGLVVESEPDFLPHQYFVVLKVAPR